MVKIGHEDPLQPRKSYLRTNWNNEFPIDIWPTWTKNPGKNNFFNNLEFFWTILRFRDWYLDFNCVKNVDFG